MNYLDISYQLIDIYIDIKPTTYDYLGRNNKENVNIYFSIYLTNPIFYLKLRVNWCDRISVTDICSVHI